MMGSMSSHPSRVRQENAFTIVEVMVAAMLLVVGLLGAVSILQGAIRTTASSNERSGANNLARELVENTRTAPYAELEAGRLEVALQAMPNMGGGTPWRITRRGVTYTVTYTACLYDDPADKVAATPDANACGAAPAGAEVGDPNGDDFRKVTYTLSWLDHGVSRSMRQNALIVNPTGGLGPRIIFVGPSTNPVLTGTTATFTATSTSAQAVHWTTDDGISEGDATGGPTSWTINWPLGTVGASGSVVDGTYKVIAQAFDVSRSVPGDSKVATVVINRNTPFALSNFIGGQNARHGGITEFSWSRTRERDVFGYRVYAGGPDQNRGGGNDQQICPSAVGAWLDANVTSCRSTNAAYTTGQHYIVALDRDSLGAVREGTESTIIIAAAGTAPSAPQTPADVIASADGQATVRWTASPTAGVMMYRIYRGGTGVANRIGAAGATATSFVDSSSPATADYYVTAVNSTFNESAPIGPLSWTAP